MTTLQDYQLIVLLVVAVFIGGMLLHVAQDISSSRKKARESRDEAARQSHKERAEHKLRDAQLNRGRMVFNWLEHELKQYAEEGFSVTKIENNCGDLSIIIRMDGIDLMQIDYSFASRRAPYFGHVYYLYGVDILFYVDSSVDSKDAERFLVLRHVEQHAELKRLSRVKA